MTDMQKKWSEFKFDWKMFWVALLGEQKTRGHQRRADSPQSAEESSMWLAQKRHKLFKRLEELKAQAESCSTPKEKEHFYDQAQRVSEQIDDLTRKISQRSRPLNPDEALEA